MANFGAFNAAIQQLRSKLQDLSTQRAGLTAQAAQLQVQIGQTLRQLNQVEAQLRAQLPMVTAFTPSTERDPAVKQYPMISVGVSTDPWDAQSSVEEDDE